MKKRIVRRILLYLAVIGVILFTLLPIYLLFVATISPSAELNAKTTHFLPASITFENYVKVFSGEANDGSLPPFIQAIRNSITVSAFTTISTLGFGIFAAYAYARFRFRGREPLLISVLGLRMVPEIVLLIPLYVLFARMSMINRIPTLVMIYTAFNLPFVIWILQGYFRSVPKEMEDSAMMDGVSHLGFLFRFIIPISAPGIIATSIFVFLMSWDEFMFATIFTSTYDAKTLTVAISEFSKRGLIDFGMQITGGFLASLPPVLMALFLQKYIINGLTEGSVKG